MNYQQYREWAAEQASPFFGGIIELDLGETVPPLHYLDREHAAALGIRLLELAGVVEPGDLDDLTAEYEVTPRGEAGA